MSPSKQRSIWKLLWQMILYAPRLYLIDSFLWLLIMGLPAMPGLIIREFFDTLTNQSQINVSPQILIALLFATGLGRIVAIFLGRITKTQHRFTISSLVQRNLLEQLFHRPGAEPFVLEDGKTVSPGEIISYFREDVAQIEDNTVGTNEILGAGIAAVVSLVILLRVSVSLTVFVFLPIVVIAVLIQLAENRIKQYRRTSRQATQQVTGLIAEMFGAVQAIQVAGAEPLVLNHFRWLSEQRRRSIVRDQVFMAALNASLENLVSVGTGLILLMAALSIASGANGLTVGDFALFVYYLAFITEFLSYLGGFLALSKQTEVAFERMTSLFSTALENNASPSALVAATPMYLQNLQGQKPPLPPVQQPNHPDKLRCLTVQNLTYCYPESDRGIFDISLSLTRGSLTVITGRVGSGKTTLLRVLLGLLPHHSGLIYWNNQLVVDPASFFIPPRSAYTPQAPQLFSYTLRENLLLGLNQDEPALKQAIALTVFEQDIALMPQGLETTIGAKGVRLSGGQQQRSAATRMIVRKPELLVFDDLSSALDVETEQQLWSRLFAIRDRSEQGETDWRPTCLVVSHRESVLQRADQIIVLDQGSILKS
jgi:ATP-binding cassette subfamily B protein/ATP-binding cassette subfamily C protein